MEPVRLTVTIDRTDMSRTVARLLRPDGKKEVAMAETAALRLLADSGPPRAHRWESACGCR